MPEGLSTEEMDRLMALGMMEHESVVPDVDRQLMRSTDVAPSRPVERREGYKGNFTPPANMTSDQEADWKSSIDESFTSQVPEAPGALATKAFGEPGGMVPPTAGDPARDPELVLDAAELTTAFSSIADPTLASDAVYAGIRTLRGDPAGAALTMALAGGGLGAGAYAHKSGLFRPVLEKMYRSRGLRPDEAEALTGKVLQESATAWSVSKGMEGLTRPGYSYFTHSVGGGHQAARIHRAGGVHDVSKSVGEHGIMFRQTETGGVIPFMHAIGDGGVSSGKDLGARLIEMATAKGGRTATWIGRAPVTFIVELPTKARSIPGLHYETILSASKGLSEAAQAVSKRLSGKGRKGSTMGGRVLNRTIPPEHIKGVLVNGKIISFDEYMGLLKPAREGKWRWRTD